MKVILFSLLVSVFAFAQTVGVKVNDVDASEGTTIEIKKGVKSADATTTTSGPQYEVTQGDENIEGDPAPLLKDARSNWKKACADWKKEFKDMNKDNKILTMNCGSQKCETQAMETTCTSKATYKLKVKLN